MTRSDEQTELTEERIEHLVSFANRAIAMGYSAPLALAALETNLVNGLRALVAKKDPERP
jgi:hypothetical protein